MGMMIFEAVILASTLSVDAFLASFAYGSNNIKIQFPTVLLISFLSSGILGIFLFLGGTLRPYLPPELSSVLCFTVLFLIGMTKILDHLMQSIIRRVGNLSKNIHFSCFHLRFILNIYADPEVADVDRSKTISLMEAGSLAVALSLDGMAAGFGAGLGEVSGGVVFLASFFTNVLAVVLGDLVGSRVAAKLRLPVSWLSGVILIGLAVWKVM